MATQRIGFLLVPGFSLSALSGATEPLRIANRVDQEELYRCDLISIDGPCYLKWWLLSSSEPVN